jgi:arylsulfatase A-like enzyme
MIFGKQKRKKMIAKKMLISLIVMCMAASVMAAPMEFAVTDDTSISIGGTTIHGADQYMNVKGTSFGLMKFDVSGIGSEIVQSVILRILTASHLPLETTVHAVADTSWEEEWAVDANAPDPGAALATLFGPLTADTWYDIDITGSITTDGTYAFALTDIASSTKARWRTKEYTGGGTPLLLVTVGGEPLPLPGKATLIAPANAQPNTPLSVELSFTPGTDAMSHDIYFGQSSSALGFKTNTQATSYAPDGLLYNTEYSWRVDEKNSSGTTEGDVWTFKTGLKVPAFSDVDLVADGKIDIFDLRLFTSDWLTVGDSPADFDRSGKVLLEDFAFMSENWKKEENRPNILFIMSDDHAQEAIGCYNSHLKDYVSTPNIDRLATEGMRFNNFACNMSLCSPSRASFVTGQYAHIHLVQNLVDALAPDSPSYMIELQKAGYQTATYGKWHMEQLPRGCDDFAITTGQGSYTNPSLSRPDGSKTNYSGYASDVYADIALDFLANRNQNKPFYLGLHFKGTHAPFDYPDRLTNFYNVPAGDNPFHDAPIATPTNLYEDNSIASPNLRNGYSRVMYDPADTEGRRSYYQQYNSKPEMPPLPASPVFNDYVYAAYQHMVHKYSRCSTAIDENVGRVVDYLRQEGLLDNTIVVYTSDQGYFLGQHQLYDKRLIYEEALKMPFIIRYPAEVPAGTVNDDLVSNVDFARTILDFADVDPDPDMQGSSFRALTQGQKPGDWQDALFYRWKKGPAHWGIRTQQYKLVLIGSLGDVTNTNIEFYDLQADPKEMNNLASDPNYADEIQALRDRLTELKSEINYTSG